MNLYEYQAKKLFSKYNIPVPNGIVYSELYELKESIQNIKSPWVGKCQIRSGGRGKSGGVKILRSEKEVESFVTYWLGKRLITYQTDDIGEMVYKILLEPCVDITRELYLSMFIDRNTSRIICLASSKGGMEIETIVKNTPNFIYKIFLDPLMGPQIYQGRRLGFNIGLNFTQVQLFTKIFINLGNMFLTHDLTLIEVNPLVITNDSNLLCLDAKIKIDRNALFRQKNVLCMQNVLQEKDILLNNDIITSNSKLNYIPMKGNIGCIVNGAGLAMATMDLLSLYGGSAANFLDIGGDVTLISIMEAIKIIIHNSKVKAIFINIFGGIVCCDLIAEGIIKGLSILNNITVPIVVRLEGNNAEFGNKKLINSKYNHHVIVSDNLLSAIQQVISIVNKVKK